MQLDHARFRTRLAETDEDLQGAQRLRYRVFVEEMGAKASEADHAQRLECDAFDAIFDHLLLIDESVEAPLDRVIGAYRLLPDAKARATRGFYGENEFDLSPILALERRSVELGRSCVAPEHRGGAAMHILWNALAEYVLSRDIEVMFGVASFHGTDPAKIAPALTYLHQKYLAPEDLRVKARAPGAIPLEQPIEGPLSSRLAMRQIPNLIKAYLRLGGFVGDGAYIDHDFNTIDVCLLMDTGRMTARYKDYYTRNAS